MSLPTENLNPATFAPTLIKFDKLLKEPRIKDLLIFDKCM